MACACDSTSKVTEKSPSVRFVRAASGVFLHPDRHLKKSKFGSVTASSFCGTKWFPAIESWRTYLSELWCLSMTVNSFTIAVCPRFWDDVNCMPPYTGTVMYLLWNRGALGSTAMMAEASLG